MCKKVFIIGTGRCGTVTLFDILSSSSVIKAIHEGRVFSRDGVQIGDLGKMFEVIKYIYYDDIKHSYIKYENSKKFTKDSKKLRVYRELNLAFFTRKLFIKTLNSDDIFCDINPFGYTHIDYIYNKYPDAKFIHLIRNGRDVVRSFCLRHSTYPDKLESKYSLYESGKPRPLVNDSYYHAWKSMDKLEKTSWFWAYVNNDIQSRLSVVPKENKMLLKIEDLSKESLFDILKFMEISGGPKHWSEVLDYSIKSNITPIESKEFFKWDQDKKIKFDKICGNTMIKFGY